MLIASSDNSKAYFTTSTKEAANLLQQGKNVVLNPDTSVIKGVPGRYTTVFWSPVHFPNQPGSMGLLIDQSNKAFDDFPTETYSNWQWWDLIMHSKSMLLDSLSVQIDPTVRVIDNFFKNRNLATIFEVSVGKGKLIICSMDIHSNMETRHAARQLRHSLIQYASSEAFRTRTTLSLEQINSLFK